MSTLAVHQRRAVTFTRGLEDSRKDASIVDPDAPQAAQAGMTGAGTPDGGGA